MPSSYDPCALDRTTIARWRQRLVGERTEEKSHWRTKNAYYRALAELLADGRVDGLSWQAIVEVVRPKGSRTTFYDVTGPNAKHSLTRDLFTGDGPYGVQLALCYHRRSAVDQLVDETKVWSFWSYREGWLDQLREDADLSVSMAVESLVRVVAEWAGRTRSLAAVLDHAPPACAVEDLMVIQGDRLCAVRAYQTLTRVVAGALTPLAETAGGVVDAVRGELGVPDRRPSTPEDVLAALANGVYAAVRESSRLAPPDAAVVRATATDLLRDAVALLAFGGEGAA